MRGGVFAATQCTGKVRGADEEVGFGNFRLFTVAEVSVMIAGGDIEDAGTLTAFYRYLAWRNVS